GTDRGEAGADEPGNQQALQERPPVRRLQRRGPEEHEALALDVSCREEIVVALVADVSLRRSAAPNPRPLVVAQERRGLAERDDDEALVLLVEERLQRPEMRERHERLPLALREQVRLVAEIVQVRPLDRA